jgi:hypothetical protein
MGLENGKCDSCEKQTNFLFPIAVTVELPTGGLTMAIRYYCIDCYETLSDAAHDELENNEEEEEENNKDEDETKTETKTNYVIEWSMT